MNRYLASLPPRGLGLNSRQEQSFVNSVALPQLLLSLRCFIVYVGVIFTLTSQDGSEQGRLGYWWYSYQRRRAREGFVCAGWERPRQLLLLQGRRSFLHSSSPAACVSPIVRLVAFSKCCIVVWSVHCKRFVFLCVKCCNLHRWVSVWSSSPMFMRSTVEVLLC